MKKDSEKGVQLIMRAAEYAYQAHTGQIDDEGVGYFSGHINQVVNVLYTLTDNAYLIASGYLHDTIEDCGVTYKQLKKEFGKKVADLVLEVTHEGDKEKGYYFPRLKSQNGILLKFVDRASNLSRMRAWSKSRKEHYLKSSKFWKDSIQ